MTTRATGGRGPYGADVLLAPTRRRTRWSAPAIGVAVAGALVAAAVAVPPLTGWVVHPLLVGGVAPLAATWDPRIGPGTLPALAVGALALRYAYAAARAAGFGRLLLLAYVGGLAWLLALATVDGWAGIAHVVDRPGEYLPTARATTDVGATLQHYVERIPHVWPTHIAGHPPGALLFFVALVRLGLGGSLATGLVIVAVAATTPLAVLLTLRTLGAEEAARRCAPLLVFGPAAIWTAVSADAVFAAVAAWGLAALAYAATATARRAPGAGIPAGIVAGLLLGYCAYLSYGLVLIALPAAGVLVAARSLRPLAWAAGGAGLVVLAFTAAGFRWWDALPVLRARYYAGIASIRPTAYWVWGDLAALTICAGPVLGAVVAVAAGRLRRWPQQRAVLSLTVSAGLAVGLADLSFMSKAEAERIWLPFVPLLLTGTALLPERWRRGALVGQVALALIVQTLLHPRW